VGYGAAVAATVCSVAYVVAQLAEWLGWLGSKGGPESMSTALGIALLLTPSLLLGVAFVLVAASIHEWTPPERRVWSLAGLAFATIYAALISITYYVQLAWILPRLDDVRTVRLEPFLFVPFDSFLYAVDILGYSFMSLATLFAAMAWGGAGAGWPVRRRARWWLTANGLLLPFIALQMYWHWLIWPAALWAVVFPGAMVAVARVFRERRQAATSAA